MPLFVSAIFLSAFLLFQVQPIIARYILPWYGGSPAVWTTCMLFFQVGLLGGYAYAHLLASKFRQRPDLQFFIHLGVVILAAVFLPITPPETLKPTGQEASEVWGIVTLLARTVGLPYIAISASGPLLQHWFAGVFPGRSPYRLYAVSNFGSLLGLLSYPFFFERALGLKHQTIWWSLGFAVYGVVALACAWRHKRAIPQKKKGEVTVDSSEKPPGWIERILWVTLAACGSAGMLAITNQMCQDVSVVPFLWVLPLGLYLTSFIICFDQEKWYQRVIWIPLVLVAVSALIHLLNQQFASTEMHIFIQIGIYLLALFTFCMVCHGEMVRIKPSSRYLTSFYLLMSLGGAVGGAFVSLVAPRIFNGYWELHFLILLVTLVVGAMISIHGFRLSKFKPYAGWVGVVATVIAFIGFGKGLRDHYEETRDGAIASLRGFHGVIRVYEFDDYDGDTFRALFHGRISHGRQYIDKSFKNFPSTYYSAGSGVGVLLESLPQRKSENREPINIGVVGLGSGSLAVHAMENDSIVFYEINPQVEQMAREQFTYLEDCRGDASVVLGDARTSMERELAKGEPRQFDVLFVDAFSGDSIPFHLMTEEAFDVYFKHLKPGGSLVCHITNLHIDLSDPVRKLAEKFGRDSLLVEHDPDSAKLYYSEWVIVTDNREVLNQLETDTRVSNWRRDEPKDIYWTDDYSNLLDVIMIDWEEMKYYLNPINLVKSVFSK